MSSSAVFSHFIFAAAIAGFSVALMTAVMVAVFFRYLVIRDFSTVTPEHTLPSLKTGGLAIVGGFLVGVSLIQLLGEVTPIKARYFWGFLASLLLIATVSLYETFKAPDVRVRLAGQIVAIAIVMGAGVVIGEFHVPWVGWIPGGLWSYPLTLLWILGLTNAYNLMDGLDGLAASTAVIASAFFSYISFQQDSVFIYLCSVALFSASLGFLIFNWLSAKFLLGAIGSIFLGFSFAVMAIIAGLYDRSHTSLLVIPLLLFHFVFDVVFTCVRKVWSAKANDEGNYLYQLLSRSGYSTRTIIVLYSAMAAAQGFGAIAMVDIPGSSRIWVFLPFLLVQAIYAYSVVRIARRKGLI